MAAAPPGALGKALVIGLGLIKRPGWLQAGHHVIAPVPQKVHEFEGHGLLLRIEVKHGGAVLIAHIGALAIQLGGIVNFKKAAQNLL